MSQPTAARPPLPLPGAATANFTTLFQDRAADPTMGNNAALLHPFDHDLGNEANNTSTEAIKNFVA